MQTVARDQRPNRSGKSADPNEAITRMLRHNRCGDAVKYGVQLTQRRKGRRLDPKTARELVTVIETRLDAKDFANDKQVLLAYIAGVRQARRTDDKKVRHNRDTIRALPALDASAKEIGA